MPASNTDLLTIGAIARRLQVPPHRVRLVVDRHNLVSRRVGQYRLVSAASLPAIIDALELNRISRQRATH